MSVGIQKRHGRRCRSRVGGRCNCTPSYEAWGWSKRDNKKIRPPGGVFTGEGAFDAAKSWRNDAAKLVQDRKLRASTAKTLSEERGPIEG